MSDVRSMIAMSTSRLSAAGHQEVTAAVPRDLHSEAQQFIHFVEDYVLTTKRQISNGDTMAYGYWLVKFRSRGEHFVAWEYAADASDFVQGVTLTLTYWRDQHEVCARLGAPFEPPRPDDLVVLSEGVLEGIPVQGVRYPSPAHMSGWWITTDRYNGDIHSLRKEHMYHLTAARPDLARYIALPFGFRFDLAEHEDLWFDANVASEEPV